MDEVLPAPAVAGAGKQIRLNVFPSHKAITEKGRMYSSLKEFATENSIDINSIVPQTWVVNSHGQELTTALQEAKESGVKYFILKPSDSFGGNNIVVIHSKDLDRVARTFKTPYVIQEYSHDVATVKNLDRGYQSKFDLRVNLVVGNNGKMLQYRPVLMRVSDNEYTIPSENQQFDTLTHITNVDLRKTITKNAMRVVTDQGLLARIDQFMMQYVRPFILEKMYKAYRDYTRSISYDERYDFNKGKLKCFQRFGVDLIALKDGTIKLLEINTNPGQPDDTGKLIQSTFWLSDIGVYPGDGDMDSFMYFESVYDLHGNTLPLLPRGEQPPNEVVTNPPYEVVTKPPVSYYINPKMFNANALMLLFYKYNKAYPNLLRLSDNWENSNVVLKFAYFPKTYVDAAAAAAKSSSNIIISKFSSTHLIDTKHKLSKSVYETFTEHTNIIPKTHIVNDVRDMELLQIFLSKKKVKPDALWIVKPSGSYGGEGIKVLRTDQLATYNLKQSGRLSELVVQEYITNPVLYNNKKFDLRINYIIDLKGRVWMYNPVLMRICDKDYDIHNLDKNIHVTNLHNREENDDSVKYLNHVKEFEWMLPLLTRFSKEYILKLFEKYILRFYKNVLSTTGIRSFQHIGIDVLVTTDKRVVLLEVNGGPGTATSDILNKVVFNVSSPHIPFEDLSEHFTELSPSADNGATVYTKEVDNCFESVSKTFNIKKDEIQKIILETRKIKNLFE